MRTILPMCEFGSCAFERDVAVAERDEQVAGGIPREPGAVAAGRRSENTGDLVGAGSAVVRVGDPDVLPLGERRAALPLRAVHGRGRVVAAAGARLRVGDVDAAV